MIITRFYVKEKKKSFSFHRKSANVHFTNRRVRVEWLVKRFTFTLQTVKWLFCGFDRFWKSKWTGENGHFSNSEWASASRFIYYLKIAGSWVKTRTKSLAFKELKNQPMAELVWVGFFWGRQNPREHRRYSAAPKTCQKIRNLSDFAAPSLINVDFEARFEAFLRAGFPTLMRELGCQKL